MKRIVKPKHGSEAWLQVRHRDADGRVVFGASEAGALMGVSEYTNLLDLCYQKLQPTPPVSETTPAMRKGVLFEDALGVNASEVLGIDLIQPEEMFVRDRFVATLDFIEPTKEEVVVECKVTNAYSIETGQDLPASWLMQGHVQHLVTGAEVWFSVFDKYQKLSVVRMPISYSTLEMLQEQSQVIGDSLDKGIIPDDAWLTANASQIGKLKPMQKGEYITLNDELLVHLQQYKSIKGQIKLLDGLLNEVIDEIARAMGSAEAIEQDGDLLFTWREQKGRSSLDQKRLAEEQPDIYKAYMREGAPYRVMRIGKNV